MESPRGVGVYNFSEVLENQIVYFNVLRLKQRFLVWIGTEKKMQGLAVAMKIPSVSMQFG